MNDVFHGTSKEEIEDMQKSLQSDTNDQHITINYRDSDGGNRSGLEDIDLQRLFSVMQKNISKVVSITINSKFMLNYNEEVTNISPFLIKLLCSSLAEQKNILEEFSLRGFNLTNEDSIKSITELLQKVTIKQIIFEDSAMSVDGCQQVCEALVKYQEQLVKLDFGIKCDDEISSGLKSNSYMYKILNKIAVQNPGFTSYSIPKILSSNEKHSIDEILENNKKQQAALEHLFNYSKKIRIAPKDIKFKFKL